MIYVDRERALNSADKNRSTRLWASGLNDIEDICSDYYGKGINRDEIFAEKVKILYSGSVYRPLLHIVPASFIFLLTFGYIDLVLSISWLVILTGINFLRYLDIRHTQPLLDQQEDFLTLRNRYSQFVFMLGFMYGLGAIYFSLLIPDISQLILLSLLTVLTPAAIVAFASDRLTFFSFFLPILIPISLQHLLWGGGLHFYIGLAAAVYLLVITGYFSWHRRLLIDALCHRIASTGHILDLVNTNKELEQLSSTDVLTGMANRRLFDFTLSREWRRMKRSRLSMSLILLDIDHFIKFNGLYGQAVGDESLCSVARAVVESCNRPLDLPARYGRDRFAVLLPDTCMEDAVVVARKIRYAIHNLSIENKDSTHEKLLTVSMGVSSSELRRTHGESDLVTFADESLALARKNGGNSIITAGAMTS